jgi:hypothetical protein
MTLEELKNELASVLMNVEVDIQAAEAHATGANIHDIKACVGSLRQYKKWSDIGYFNDILWLKEEHFRHMITTMQQTLCRMNLLRIGNDCRTAEREAKKLFNPGKFPEKEE